ncbi:RNA polymerase sigma factor SigM [Gordonia rubripertincta]|uniref:RNA polymerase sigma factor SigM n=2 Tax=Gordonia rubripertincta TaxID=36822 RepID=A0AAW6RA16_GORRU|nr:RNA polymerase sigma factor SigM [Gordonia rubripertincta]ASR05533.1 ECF RNA polymerase sigma factor SigM [Gordonia rubripertincta]MBM7276190.1 RNA polymerase sigma factor SigM [Gordonia rubripertincta]MDG6782784.1 RNA polymerase sigma factor SigM [Gordonia rubripertincta]NKY63993.1 RNA polymerase sigma factor SigM [Gordonia rubripertincta]QMU21755.1 RNA polymerase sigma factor SigM [Gordonia rubripertincta]
MAGGNDAVDLHTDEQLLRAHAAGDPGAFTDLINRHLDYLWSVAIRTSQNPEDAADGLQDALLAAHRTAGDFRSDAKVTSWLHRIVVNACLDRIRRNNARRTVPLPEWDVLSIADTADDIAAVDLSVSIGRALHALPEGQRQAIVAVDLEGYSVAEAASLLGVAEGTIKSRCARGRLKLAQVLGHLRTADDA